MDELSDALSSLLSSPESMERLKSLASSLLGDAGDEEEKEQSSPAAAAEPAGANGLEPSPLAGIDLSMVTKLMPLLSQLNQEDDNTKLLKALRPHLHGDRQKRLDEASKLMQLIKLLPILRQQGLF